MNLTNQSFNISESTHIQHIAIFLKVSIESSFENSGISDDTSGSEWINLDEITTENSSPLVIVAKEYVVTNKFEMISLIFDNWLVNENKM